MKIFIQSKMFVNTVINILIILFFVFNFLKIEAKDNKRVELGYRILNFEKECGFSFSNDFKEYKILDSILKIAQKEIRIKTDFNYNKIEAIGILKNIGNIIKKQFQLDSTDRYKNSLFSSSLLNKNFDCDKISLTYLTIAENLILPINGIFLPGHMCVSWKFQKDSIFWETTANKEMTLDEYKVWLNIPENSFLNHIYPIYADKNVLNGWLYKTCGLAFKNSGKLDSSIKYFSLSIQLSPFEIDGYINRGNVYAMTNQFEKAFIDYNKTIEINPKFAKSYFNRGTAYILKKEYKKAINDFDKTIYLKPDHYDAFNNRGISNKELGKYVEALSDFNSAIQINPNFSNAYDNRGLLYLEKQEFQLSIPDFSKVILLDPNNAMVYFRRGTAYIGLENPELALDDFNKFIKIAKDIPYDKTVQENVKIVKKQILPTLNEWIKN